MTTLEKILQIASILAGIAIVVFGFVAITSQALSITIMALLGAAVAGLNIWAFILRYRSKFKEAAEVLTK
jgi:primosomal replication protein N